MNKIIKIRVEDCKTIEWEKIKKWEFNDLKDDKRDLSRLKNALINEGFCFPLYVWADHQYVCDGTGRQKALIELEKEGWAIPDLPIVGIEAPNKQAAKKLALMASSRHGIITNKSFQSFIDDLEIEDLRLDINLPEIKLDVFDVEISKLDKAEVNKLKTDLPLITQLYDVWQLNEHRIMCGDSRDKLVINKLLDGKKAQMIFTDPPYNLATVDFAKVGAEKHKDFAFAGGEMKTQQFAEFLKDIFKNLVSISSDGSIHYICMDWRHIPEIMEAGLSVYTDFKNLCVWAKDQPGNGSFYRSQHELVFVFKNGKAKHINNFELGQFGRTRSNIWEYPSAMSFANPDRKREGNVTKDIGQLENHPTPKPVQMVVDCCLDCSEIGGIVFDAFLGSGTTLIAAEKTKRICYASEIEPKYVDSSIFRWIEQKLNNNENIQLFKNNVAFDYKEFFELTKKLT